MKVERYIETDFVKSRLLRKVILRCSRRSTRYKTMVRIKMNSFWPSKNLEAFIQETGRAGRDGKPSFSYMLDKGLMPNHAERDIKEYLKTKECWRKTLLKHFGSGSFTISGPLHTCCDNCAKRCDCSSAECSTYTLFIISDKENLDSSLQEKRKVKDSEKKVPLVPCHVIIEKVSFWPCKEFNQFD